MESKSWYYDDGRSLMCTIMYKDGMRDGETVWYRKNGNKKKELTYKLGYLCGEARWYIDDITGNEVLYRIELN